MASTQDFIEYAVEQIDVRWNITYKKMFGEYMIYTNKKPIFLVCDNTVFIKQHDEITELMADKEKGFPYPGAKEHYIVDIDDKDLCDSIITIIEPKLKIPQKRKKSK